MGHGPSKAAKQQTTNQTKHSNSQLETKANEPNRTSGATARSNATGRYAIAIRPSSKQHLAPDNQALNRQITSFLSTAELGVFSQLNRTCYADIKSELDKRAAQPLLVHTVKGEEKQARAMLASNPSLLLINSAKTVDYSGKKIEDLTPFQAALCAGDADMVMMMQPYFDKMDNGSQKMADQIHTVFPKGYDAHLHTQTESTFNCDSIFNAIAHASDADVEAALSLSGASFEQTDEARSKPDRDLTLVEALNRFRETFSQKSLSETIYNPQHLLRAFALYIATFEPGNGTNWNWPKRDLFWRQIVGFCQRFIPACTAQAFAQGLFHLVKVPEYHTESWKEEHFNRSLKFRYGGGSIYPIMSCCSGLGFNYACIAAKPATLGLFLSRTHFIPVRPGAVFGYVFKNFISIKSASICEAVSRSIRPPPARGGHP